MATLLLAGCGSSVAAPPTEGATDGATHGGGSSTSTSSPASDDSGSSSGGAPTFEGPYGSGSRLTAHVLRAAGGAEMLQWFYDQELGIECTFARDPEGVVRCLPRGLSRAAHSETGPYGYDRAYRTAFTGPDCETPVLVLDVCEAQIVGEHHYTSEVVCGPGPAIRQPFTLGEGLRETGWEDGDGVCNVRTLDEDETAYVLVPADFEQFASAEAVLVDGVRVLSGEDGSWQNLEVVDTNGRGCPAGRDHCVPSPAAFISSSLTSGPDCDGEPVIATLASEDCDDTPTHAIPFDHGPVDLDVIHALGDSLDVVSREESEECEQFEGRYWALGESVPAETLLPLHRVDVGEGGVVTRHLSHDDLPRVARALVDVSTGDDCQPWFDGERHWCVPWSVWWSATSQTEYLDPACTEPAFGSRSELPFGATRTSSDCTAQLTLFELESVPDHGDEPLYVLDASASCVQRISSSDFVYRVGEPYQLESVLYELTPATL